MLDFILFIAAAVALGTAALALTALVIAFTQDEDSE